MSLIVARKHLRRGSIAKIAKELGVSSVTVSKVLKGESVSRRIAAALMAQAVIDSAITANEVAQMNAQILACKQN